MRFKAGVRVCPSVRLGLAAFFFAAGVGFAILGQWFIRRDDISGLLGVGFWLLMLLADIAAFGALLWRRSE